MNWRGGRALRVVGGVAAAWTAAGGTAYAYIDPGSTSLVLQALVGAAAAAGLLASAFMSRLRALPRRLLRRWLPGMGKGRRDACDGDEA